MSFRALAGMAQVGRGKGTTLFKCLYVDRVDSIADGADVCENCGSGSDRGNSTRVAHVYFSLVCLATVFYETRSRGVNSYILPYGVMPKSGKDIKLKLTDGNCGAFAVVCCPNPPRVFAYCGCC